MRTVVLLLAALAGSFLATAADRELSGRVVDANTGEPVSRAHLTVRFYQGGQPPQEVSLLSDADGTFKITDLPVGGFQVACEKAGYLPANQGAGAAPVNPADGNSVTAMIIRLTAQAAVEGTVVDDRDVPAANAFIQLVRQQVVSGRKQWQVAQGGTTDETGAFRIFSLPAGRYYISVTARLQGARRSQALAYPQFYYPNTSDLAAAQPLDLKAGDEADVSIRLPQPAPAYEIRGVVDTGSENASVLLLRQGSNASFQSPAGDVKWDGKTKSFKISHVTPGIYLLQATVREQGSAAFATAPVTVGDSDVTGIRLEPAVASLDGTVRMDDGSQQRVAGYVSVQSERGGSGAPVDAQGKFHVANIQPGTYRIVPQIGGPQACVRSILAGGRDVRDGLTVGGEPPEPIDIVMSSHCGSIDVTLSASDDTLPPNLTAYLLRRAGDEYVLERQGYAGPKSSDGSIHFLIMGVPAGDYMAFVWPSDAPIEYANADSMRQYDSFGQRVSVADDSKAQVTIDKPLIVPAKN